MRRLAAWASHRPVSANSPGRRAITRRAVTETKKRLGIVSLRKKPIAIPLFCRVSALREQPGRLLHPGTSLLVIHLHDRLIRPVQVIGKYGYLLAELAEGVADNSPEYS